MFLWAARAVAELCPREIDLELGFFPKRCARDARCHSNSAVGLELPSRHLQSISTLRSFDQKKSVAYPGRFSVRVAIWLPRLLPRNVVVSAAASATGKMGPAS